MLDGEPAGMALSSIDIDKIDYEFALKERRVIAGWWATVIGHANGGKAAERLCHRIRLTSTAVIFSLA
jgi:hypothetical protein